MLSRAQAAAAEDGPLEVAMAATAEAHQLRATGAPASQAWIAAAERWDALGRPLCAAACRWRRAESCLEHGEREPAAQAVAEALAAARRLGSGWLVGELEGLATRARLPLGATASAPGAAGAPGAAAAAPEADADPFGLTARERQVLGLVARGATNRQIGEELYMAEKTASVHVSRILAKLDVRTRTEAAAVAHRLGLTTQPGTDGETG
jgi:DNA-binding CsgD family transcriptional regulator